MSLISVIIPTYNCAEYIAEAIDSVLNQTFTDFEIIVVDDGSTDETAAIMKRYGDKVRYIRQKNNGPAVARNLGINTARGEFIAFLDADDIWHPEKLEIQHHYLEEHTECALVYANCSTFTETGLKTAAYDGTHRKVYSGNIFDRLYRRNFIACISVMLRKECLETTGLFPEHFDKATSEDWHLWLRIAYHFPIGCIDQPLAKYRWKESSLTGDFTYAYPYRRMVLDEITALYPGYFQNKKNLVRRTYADFFMRYGYALYKSHDYKNSRGNYLLSIYRNPFQFKSYLYLIVLLIPRSFLAPLARFKSKFGIRFMPAE